MAGRPSSRRGQHRTEAGQPLAWIFNGDSSEARGTENPFTPVDGCLVQLQKATSSPARVVLGCCHLREAVSHVGMVEDGDRPSPATWAGRFRTVVAAVKHLVGGLGLREGGWESKPSNRSSPCVAEQCRGGLQGGRPFMYHLSKAAKARLLIDGPGGSSPASLASLGKLCSRLVMAAGCLGLQSVGMWSRQSGKAGLVGHCGRLRGTALISRE